MRKTIVYYRNSPSILFWEAGNAGIAAERMKQMVDIRKDLDPSGGRAMGCRTLQASRFLTLPGDATTDSENTHTAEWFGVMAGQDRQTDQLQKPTELYRAFRRLIPANCNE
jgi:beta-galactosidase